MVTYIPLGNIFNIEGVYNYAHGCNCAGAMGKGIAVQFKQKFPQMYKQYKLLCDKGEFNLGDVFAYNYGNGYVYNLGTQASWRTKATLTAIEKSLEKMLDAAALHGITKIALPKIGAGLGGLQWQYVKAVIENVAQNNKDITLFVVEDFKE